ncbi:SRPBCC family protein [Nocardioides sp. LMS-CY]|uniref:SRPBCC family protein n=1 Tax=Nocardioides sp. (strain LMS-CY) TaxID=2840457 RepID=UPI001C007E8D|nr:SRPBCC family protein [Nocardioides sp. LMS-CY]QWF21587.1 SRPBCC family protein [Nocardioides sp. LMS-CY]
MDLTHRFTVPTSVDDTWAHFNDIASVAECFPGATVTSVDGDTFSGSVKVKLGPIALVYNGSGTFVEKDEAAHRFVVDAKGRDKRGNGTAGAKVTLTMTPSAVDGTSTDVEVVTDLAITGKPAQFGRGVMQDVSDKLLGQFVECLERRLSAESTGAPQERTPTSEQVAEAAPAPASATPPEPAAADDAAEIVRHEMAAGRSDGQPERDGPSQQPAPSQADDALDLGSAVLPVLARTYWKQGLGLLAVIGLVIWWISRRD